jgi:hypothetical protein
MTTNEGRHAGVPVETTEILLRDGIWVERDPGKYVGRHRLTRIWRWRRNVGGRFRVNRKKLQ